MKGKTTKSGIRSKYAKKRGELIKTFHSLKKQGFTEGSYKDTKEYKNLIKAEKSALYRFKNKDKINERRQEKRRQATDIKGLVTTTAAQDAAYKVFSGGKNSSYFKVLSLLLKGRTFFGFIDIIKNDDGFPEIRTSNPYMSVAGYFKKVRQIIDFIQNDTEHEYLFLSVFVTIKFTYSKDKVIVTHIFDFSDVE